MLEGAVVGRGVEPQPRKKRIWWSKNGKSVTRRYSKYTRFRDWLSGQGQRYKFSPFPVGGSVRQLQLPGRGPPSFVEKLHARISQLFAAEQSVYEKARADIESRLQDIRERKKNLVLHLIGQKVSPSDVELYGSVKADLESEEQRLNGELAKAEDHVARAVRTIEIALSLAANCYYAYQKAEPELKALLVLTFFKKLVIKDKQITQAVLNEPLDYLCRPRLQKYPVFGLAAVGRHSEDWLEQDF